MSKSTLVITTYLAENLDKYDLVIFEGYEMTGKSYLLDLIKTRSSRPVVTYRPDWENNFSDTVIRRGNRYIPGLVAVDIFKRMKGMISRHPTMVIDRWVPSWYVYQQMYEQGHDYSSFDRVMESVRSITEGLNILIVHKYHSSRDEAQEMYQLSTADSNHQDQYDDNLFEEYYANYLRFEEVFQQFYRENNFEVLMVSSYNNQIKEVATE